MKNWKIIAIIVATAIATAVAVVVLVQKQNNKRRMRFDSAEFDDDCMDDIACGEQCTCCSEDLDVELPGEAESAAAEEDEAPIDDIVTAEELLAQDEESAE